MILLVLPDLSTDNALLTALHRDGADAIDAIYARYFAPLYHYARLKVGDAALAEDIVHEVFYQLVRTLGMRSMPQTHLRGWLFRVARSEIALHVGKARQLPVTNLEEWMPASPESNPEIQLGDLAHIDRVRHAMRMLTEPHQEVLVLRFGQHLSLQETADIMGKSVSAIKALQFRALDTLRGILLDGEDSRV